MFLKHLKLRYSTLIFFLYLFQQNVTAQTPEFDNSFLYGENSKTLDLTTFNHSEKVPEGDYLLDIFLNDRYITRSIVHITDDPENPLKQSYCIPKNTVQQLDFNTSLIDLKKTPADCIDTRLMNHVVFWKLDISQQRVDITSPQAMLNECPYGYINPILWEDGANSAFLKYYYNYYHSEFAKNEKHDSDFLNLNAGINFGSWQFRHSGSTSFKGGNEQKYFNDENKFLHVLPNFKSQLTLGDFYSDTRTLNTSSNFAIRGIQIASDERMQPASLQNYAPSISGYAKTNALIRVRQNQQILLERSVPAGAFNITDLFTPGTGGTISVDVIEANGEIRSFDIPYNNFIQTIRPNQYRYQIALGNYRQHNQTYNEKILNVSLDYGLNNFISLSNSGLLSDHYQSITFGTAFNTTIGGLAIEGNYVQSNIKQYDYDLDSYLINMRYNLSLNNAKTNISLNNTFYGNDQYYSFDEVMQNHYLQKNNVNLSLNGRPKTFNYAQVTQNLGNAWGVLNLNYSYYKFWNQVQDQNFFQVSYSNTYKNLSYYLGFQHNDNHNDLVNADTQYFVNISIPLSVNKKNTNIRMNSEYYPEKSNQNTSQIGIFGSLGANAQMNYSLNYANNQEQDALSSSLSYRTSPFSLASTFTTDFKNQQQYSLQAQGAVVAHRHGLTLSNDLNDTFAIIHAKGLEGTELLSGQNSKIDRWGNAILPYLNPYQYNTIALNPNTIPLNTEVDSTQLQVVPKYNSSIIANFSASKSQKALIELHRQQGLIPMGAQVVDSNKKLVTVIGQGQQLFLSPLKTGNYIVRWNNSESCQFTVSNEMLLQSQTTIPFANFNLLCRPLWSH